MPNPCPRTSRLAVLVSLAASLVAVPAGAQIVVSANDAKVELQNGVQTVVASPPSDSVTVLDFGVSPPRIVGTVDVPTSVIGPPMSVAIAPDETFALVTAAQRLDPANPGRSIANDVVSVIALEGTPRVVATLHAGAGASGVSINRAGTLALVANRVAGTLSVFAIDGMRVTPAGTVDLGAPDSGPSHVVFTPDGRTALVTRNNDNLITMLAVDGTTVTRTGDMASGLKPYGIEVLPSGDRAVVGHIGAGATGSADTVGVLDLRATPPQGTEQTAVGPIAEGLDVSPDGRFVAVTVMNGSNQPAGSPLYRDHGLLRILGWDGPRLVPVAEAPIGHWCQGATWVRGGAAIAVECMVEKTLQVFTFDGTRLTPGATVPMPASPAGLRAAER